jgi:DoxX-like family
MHSKSTSCQSSTMVTTVTLWITQALLALLFLFAGGMKLVVPLEVLTQQVPLPGLVVRFIGVIEVLGAIGLILPALLRIRPRLTALAAAALALEMVVATVFSLVDFGVPQAVLPLVVGFLSTFVACGRFRLAHNRAASRPSVLQPAS